MRIGLIGDLHNNSEPAIKWMLKEKPDFCIQVGDFWSYNKEWPVPTCWFFGNHENLDVVEKMKNDKYFLPKNNYWFRGGTYHVYGIKIACVPSIPANDRRPGPTKLDMEAYSLCEKHAGEDFDLFVSHECGFEFKREFQVPTTNETFSKNFENKAITSLLKKMKPKFAVSGHNHRFEVKENEGITCIRLGMTGGKEQFAYMLEI